MECYVIHDYGTYCSGVYACICMYMQCMATGGRDPQERKRVKGQRFFNAESYRVLCMKSYRAYAKNGSLEQRISQA